MDRRQLADVVIEALSEGIVPWRYPINVMPEFKQLFETFFAGEPLAAPDYSEVAAMIAATGVKIVRHWRVAKPRCERPPHERILMPLRSRFWNEAQWQASLIHETLHYLEQPHRVGWVGSYHQAELVAEVGTGFIESHLRLPHDEDSANIVKWLPAWENGIRADPAYLFDAVAQADKAARYLLGLTKRQPAKIERGTVMPEQGDKKGSPDKTYSLEDYDRLVQGCEDYFFGGVVGPEGEKEPPPGEPSDEPPKNPDGGN